MEGYENVHKLRRQVHKLMERWFNWDNKTERANMYKYLVHITGINHIGDMNQQQLTTLRNALLKLK